MPDATADNSRPTFLRVNGRALVLQLLALPAGALLLFGLELPDPVAFGALLGWGLGLGDLLVSGTLFSAALKRGDVVGAFRQVAIGLAARIIVVVLVVIALRRLPAFDGTAFALAFVASHLISIGGWAWKLADGKMFLAATTDKPASEDRGERP